MTFFSLYDHRYPQYRKKQLPPSMVRHMAKPYDTKLRVDSSLQAHAIHFAWKERNIYTQNALLEPARRPFECGVVYYREKCMRHDTRYRRCTCFLPHVEASAAAHVASIEAAMGLARPDQDRSRCTILMHDIPNQSQRMWRRPRKYTMS
jgi:hypothetical protein